MDHSTQRQRDALWRLFLVAIGRRDRMAELTLSRRLFLIDYRTAP
jgi:hypothetical protein